MSKGLRHWLFRLWSQTTILYVYETLFWPLELLWWQRLRAEGYCYQYMFGCLWIFHFEIRRFGQRMRLSAKVTNRQCEQVEILFVQRIILCVKKTFSLHWPFDDTIPVSKRTLSIHCTIFALYRNFRSKKLVSFWSLHVLKRPLLIGI